MDLSQWFSSTTWMLSLGIVTEAGGVVKPVGVENTPLAPIYPLEPFPSSTALQQ